MKITATVKFRLSLGWWTQWQIWRPGRLKPGNDIFYCLPNKTCVSIGFRGVISEATALLLASYAPGKRVGLPHDKMYQTLCLQAHACPVTFVSRLISVPLPGTDCWHKIWKQVESISVHQQLRDSPFLSVNTSKFGVMFPQVVRSISWLTPWYKLRTSASKSFFTHNSQFHQIPRHSFECHNNLTLFRHVL
jgi:hypothetical protein